MRNTPRREFLQRVALATSSCLASDALAQVPGERPPPNADITVMNPRTRVPVGLIIDDSTCLVNLNRFAMPQFAETFPQAKVYQRDWKKWPTEIPDAFVRKFGDWCNEKGIKGKYSIVPYQSTHNIGGAVMGTDPSLSVVNKYLQSWDVNNVFVVGGSAFPQNSANPPTATIGALACWAADAIKENYLKKPGLLV